MTNNLLAEFQRLHKEIPGDPPMYFVNIPVNYHGVAIAGITCSQSMNHRPFSQQDFDSSIWLLDSDQSLPIGFMQNLLEQGKSHVYFYYLNAKDQHFYPVNFPRLQLQSPASRTPTVSINIGGVEQKLPIVDHIGIPTLTSDHKPTFILSSPSTKELTPWLVDAIVFQLNIPKPKKLPNTIPVEFGYLNDAQPEKLHTDHLLVPLNQLSDKQSIILPLRGLPIWSCGGHCHMMKLSFPENYKIEMHNAFAASIKTLIPQIVLTSPNYDSRIGELVLNSKYPQSVVSYDVNAINNCAGVVAEIIEPGKYYTELNTCHSDGHSVIPIISMHPKGEIKLVRSMFKCSGPYKIRLRPINKQGKQISFCSDHFMLLVSN